MGRALRRIVSNTWAAREAYLPAKSTPSLTPTDCPCGSALPPVKLMTTASVRCFWTDLRPQTIVLADRGYDADWIREFVSEQGAWANIPRKKNRKAPICFSPDLYRSRNLVERFFNKIKQCRRIATRYDKLGANYLSFIKLASIRI